MNIETTKLELMQLLLNTHNESILMKIKRIYEEESSDWWSELSKEEQTEIEIGLKQIETGELTNHNEVMKLFDQWK